MRTISGWLHRVSSGYTIILSIICYGLFLGLVMAPQASVMQAFAGSWGAPDGHFFYTPDKLYSELNNWSAAGRQHYINFRLGLDPVWALVYTAFLISITSVSTRFAFTATDSRQLLNLPALLPMLADLAENALGIALVAAWPERHDLLAWFTASVSAFKWSSLAAAHFVMLYALGVVVFIRVFGRNRKQVEMQSTNKKHTD